MLVRTPCVSAQVMRNDAVINNSTPLLYQPVSTTGVTRYDAILSLERFQAR